MKGAGTRQYVHLPGLVWHAQLSRYQEQAQLLDPHLSSIVEPLAAVLRETAEANLSGDTSAIVAVSQMLWAVATIRSVRCPPASQHLLLSQTRLLGEPDTVCFVIPLLLLQH